MKVVMVEPNKPAYVTEIGSDYQSLHYAVGGLIEPIYYLDEPNVVMVGNEEAKLIGLDCSRDVLYLRRWRRGFLLTAR